jgi:hypothetical protein
MARGLDLLKQRDHVGLGLEPVVLSPAHLVEISARAERLAGAPDHHRPDARVALERVEAPAQRVHERGVERVAALGTVQGDGRDAVGHRVQDFVGHGRTPGV